MSNNYRLLAFWIACSACANGALVESVSVPGTAIEVRLATQVGQSYDTRSIEQDVRYLWSLRRFDDIRVETREASGHGVAVIFHATPRQFLTIRRATLEPNPLGLAIVLPEGGRIDRERIQEMAAHAQTQVHDRGFHNARVSYELIPTAHNEMDLKLKMDPGESVRVRRVEFAGETAIPAAMLANQLRALRPRRILPRVSHVWNGWQLLPSYTPAAVEADLTRLRSYYFLNGYFDSHVQVIEGGAQVKIEIQAGPRRENRPASMCPILLSERRAAERNGILDFTAAANVDASGRLTWITDQGPAYHVGRIEFTGNHRHSDAFVRRNFLLDEGDPLDERRLRQSVMRLNRSGAFENIDERHVAILRNPKTGVADVRIRLVERKHGSWNLSGPVGSASFAGPLQGSIGMSLPAWGRGILELSTYVVSLNAFAFGKPLLPVVGSASKKLVFPALSLQRPYSPGEGWRSGFTIVPQLGWQSSVVGYLSRQLEERLMPALNGNRGITPELPVTVHRESTDIGIVCEPPAPRMSTVRGVAAMALHVFASMSAI